MDRCPLQKNSSGQMYQIQSLLCNKWKRWPYFFHFNFPSFHTLNPEHALPDGYATSRLVDILEKWSRSYITLIWYLRKFKFFHSFFISFIRLFSIMSSMQLLLCLNSMGPVYAKNHAFSWFVSMQPYRQVCIHCILLNLYLPHDFPNSINCLQLHSWNS